MQETSEWWVSCNNFTCWIKTRDGVIIDSAPIAKRWIGQSMFKFVDYYQMEVSRLSLERIGK